MDKRATTAYSIPFQPTSPYTSEERAAMRAYLQRCEVRLSTMHRVVTAFVSGAALMVLIPVFFKDVIASLIQILINDFGNRFPAYSDSGIVLTMIFYVTVVFVLGMSFVVPLRGLYLLLKDVIDFYIIISTPGTKETEELRNPAFALTGVSFSSDESERVKREVLAYQYEAQSIDFMLPFSARRRHDYFAPLLEATAEVDPATNKTSYRIIPIERDMEHLLKIGILRSDLNAEEVQNILYFNAAVGVGRSYDRRLVEEVAKTEMSLVRHSLYLRRLVFRYAATLMIFIWTMIVSFILLAVIQSNMIQKADPSLSLLLIALSCLGWTLPLRYILHRPVDWIFRPFRNGNADYVAGEDHLDPQLIRLESTLKPYHTLALICSVIAVALGVLAYWQAVGR